MSKGYAKGQLGTHSLSKLVANTGLQLDLMDAKK